MPKNLEKFNIVIVGTGGQGLITLLQIIAEAALFEGYEVRTSELHGLSQRGGSVEVHIRFGQKIYSPLVSQGKADLILGLEMQEALRGIYFANQKTKFLLNKQIIPMGPAQAGGRRAGWSPLVKNLTETEILKNLKKIGKVILIPAAETCQKEFNTNVVAGIYLISLASFKNLIPLKPNSISRAIKKIIPEKYLELNLKTFKLAKTY